jgi:hypothetical protein
MFSFQSIGKVTGLSTSRDGRTAYLKLHADPVPGVDLMDDEKPDVVDVACAVDLLPPGCGLGTRVQIEGSGAIAAREWLDRNKPGSKPKTIHNTRLQARSIKLAK